MDALHVSALLDVWEETNAPLAACRDALEASGSSRKALEALELLPPAEVARPPTPADELAGPAKLLATYKSLARELRDVSPGTLPRSLVWVTEQATSNLEVVARWERHRYFLGAPFVRSFANGAGASSGPRRVGGHLRLERDPTQPPCAPRREESMLALWDARWVIAGLTRFARRTAMRVAVELRGVAGWVDGRGPDSNLEGACARFFDVEGVCPVDMRAAFDALDKARVRELLDRYPGRRDGVTDCGGAGHYEVGLLRTERVLGEVDLVEGAAGGEQDACDALDSAATSAGIHELLAARAGYRSTGPASFPEVLDRLLLEHGGLPIGSAWREVRREEAISVWREALETSLAYRTPLVDAEAAARLVDAFVASFDPDALFFRNGSDTAYTPVLGTTLESGAAVVDTQAAGLLFIGDED